MRNYSDFFDSKELVEADTFPHFKRVLIDAESRGGKGVVFVRKVCVVDANANTTVHFPDPKSVSIVASEALAARLQDRIVSGHSASYSIGSLCATGVACSDIVVHSRFIQGRSLHRVRLLNVVGGVDHLLLSSAFKETPISERASALAAAMYQESVMPLLNFVEQMKFGSGDKGWDAVNVGEVFRASPQLYMAATLMANYLKSNH